jgi:CubicO group peptidase (beta-lactamase class C family)
MLRTRLAVTILVCASLFAGESPAAPGPPEPIAPEVLRQRLDAFIRPLDEAGEVSGTLLVARDDQVLYERAFGMANYELRVANTLTTRFCIASVTKPMTAILAHRLVERGKLSLSDPVRKWLPDFPRGQEILVEHLLRHRAGLPHRVTTDAEETVPRTASDMVRFASRAPFLSVPGTQNAYSSAGYSVLARILELAGGKPYGELLAQEVLEPVGARHTAHVDARQLLPERASGYLRGLDGPVNGPLHDLSFLVGAGSVFSNARDVFAVQRALLTGRYGADPRASLVREGELRWNGITDGYRAFADYHGGTRLSVIFTGNLFTGAADALRRAVPRLAAGEELAPAPVPRFTAAPMPSERRRQIEGVYRLRPGSEEPLRFEEPEGRQATLGFWLLIPIGEDRFHSPQDYATVQVIRADGAVTALEWRIPESEPIRFERLRALPPA